ncbi:MAG TPA: M48 family metallopeptidase [bacterium]|nr:M48 family metallopeptidase [bacterium]
MQPPEHLYDQIARNKRNSVLLMISAFLLLTVLGFVFGNVYEAPVSGIVIAVGAASLYLAVSYWAGSRLVMLSMGGREIEKRDNPVLFNVVEEMAIAAGLPMPRVFLINTPASNAFAAGMRPDKAMIAATTGLMEQLNREELQAVIGHEMGHIKNFDSRFSILMAVMVGSIALLCDMFWRSLRGSRRSDSKGGGQAQLIFVIAAVVLAILAPIVAKIIQFSMSRRRELLADNTGAELTRNPGALANALLKIAADPDELDIANRGTQHLFIINPLKAAKDVKAQAAGNAVSEKAGWFDTHPPIALRVRLLKEMAKLPT